MSRHKTARDLLTSVTGALANIPGVKGFVVSKSIRPFKGARSIKVQPHTDEKTVRIIVRDTEHGLRDVYVQADKPEDTTSAIIGVFRQHNLPIAA